MDNQTREMEELIVRYLDGSASPGEETELLQWIGLSEENRNDFIRTKDLWLLCEDASADKALQRFRSRIQAGYAETVRPKALRRRLTGWWQTAGVVVLCLATGYGAARLFPGKETLVRNQLITAPGSKGSFTLPDGTRVWLNSNSKLVYPEAFRDKQRIVSLEGEAYFEVAENKEQAFVVRSGDVRVEALGTAFDLAGYPSDSLVEAVLLEGSLRISGKDFPRGVVLKPNRLFAYNKEKKEARVHKAKAGLYIDWIKNRLVFDNDCLADIKISMEGWYNVSIDCPEDFANHTRMSFTIRGESIDEILKAMSFIVHIRYSVEGRRVKIIPKE